MRLVTGLLPLVVLALSFVVAWRLRHRRRVTEPACAACGYNVTGLEGTICPECGGNLSVVGILQPGTQRPLPRRVKIVAATSGLLLPAMLVGMLSGALLAPAVVTTSLQRFIFVTTPSSFFTVQAELIGERRGQGAVQFGSGEAMPQDRVRLSIRAGPSNALRTLDADLSDERRGDFAAATVEPWLRSIGYNRGPLLPEIATHIVDAVNNMRDGNGGGFERYMPDPARNGLEDMIAHPAGFPWTARRLTPFGTLVQWIAGGFSWLAGVMVAVRLTRPRPITASASASAPARR